MRYIIEMYERERYERERSEMVERLIAYGYLSDKAVAEAMKKVPRHLFVLKEEEPYAYDDRPLPAGEDQTISAPHMVAMMCQALEPRWEHKVLEIGCGTGYHACVMAQMAERVYSVERLESLAERAKMNLKRAGCDRVAVVVGDGSRGYEPEAPYDRIYVTAGAPEIPLHLVEQLKPGGRLLVPVGAMYYQDLMLVVKTLAGELRTKSLGACAFVPLIGEYGWRSQELLQ